MMRTAPGIQFLMQEIRKLEQAVTSDTLIAMMSAVCMLEVTASDEQTPRT